MQTQDRSFVRLSSPFGPFCMPTHPSNLHMNHLFWSKWRSKVPAGAECMGHLLPHANWRPEPCQGSCPFLRVRVGRLRGKSHSRKPLRSFATTCTPRCRGCRSESQGGLHLLPRDPFAGPCTTTVSQLAMAAVYPLAGLGPLPERCTIASAPGGKWIRTESMEHYSYRLYRLGGILWSRPVGLPTGTSGAGFGLAILLQSPDLCSRFGSLAGAAFAQLA